MAASAFVVRGTAGASGGWLLVVSVAVREKRVARRHRECLDKYLPRVKIFEYANDGGHK